MINKIREFLKENSDEEYKKFNSKIIPGIGECYGVRMPVIKKYVKQIIKDKSLEENILELKNCFLYEEKIVLGMLIAEKKYETFEDFYENLYEYICYINNWALCDLFASNMKMNIKKYFEKGYEMSIELMKDTNPWAIRLGVVMILCHYYDYNVDRTIEEIEMINSEEYYVKIGIAWALSVLYVHNRELIGNLIKSMTLKPWIQNKTIQKIIESLRVENEEKEELKKYKIK